MCGLDFLCLVDGTPVSTFHECKEDAVRVVFVAPLHTHTVHGWTRDVSSSPHQLAPFTTARLHFARPASVSTTAFSRHYNTDTRPLPLCCVLCVAVH